MLGLLASMCINTYCIGRTESEINVLIQERKILDAMKMTEENAEFNNGILYCLTELDKRKTLIDTKNNCKQWCKKLIRKVIQQCQNIKNQLDKK